MAHIAFFSKAQMESNIHFVDSHTLTPKPEVTTGQVLVSNQELTWDSV